ncbi:MAG: hypothetical protein NVV66_16485 [Cellulomonas sp.]|uniref:hypothetical protein n=1 Tax=Cellulomonas sp. TaxID=40001 RepID=UPI0025900AAC|nr:hypothetical protein [Cellulomonas sp.]MCR6706213.1 hypothetical protein [Cellulomonas sp.]
MTTRALEPDRILTTDEIAQMSAKTNARVPRRQLRRRLPVLLEVHVLVVGRWDPSGTWCTNVELATVTLIRPEGPEVAVLRELTGRDVQWPEVDEVALEHLHALGLDEVDADGLDRVGLDPDDHEQMRAFGFLPRD